MFAKCRSKVHTFYDVFYGETVIGTLVFSKNYWVRWPCHGKSCGNVSEPGMRTRHSKPRAASR